MQEAQNELIRPSRLFVYGTLRSDVSTGGQAAVAARRLLARGAHLEGLASTSGRLHDLGAYPAFLPGGPGRVSGELWRIRDPGLPARLDAYEGRFYVREAVRVLTKDGRRVTAVLYRYRLTVTGVSRIASGDYLDWVRTTHERALRRP